VKSCFSTRFCMNFCFQFSFGFVFVVHSFRALIFLGTRTSKTLTNFGFHCLNNCLHWFARVQLLWTYSWWGFNFLGTMKVLFFWSKASISLIEKLIIVAIGFFLFDDPSPRAKSFLRCCSKEKLHAIWLLKLSSFNFQRSSWTISQAPSLWFSIDPNLQIFLGGYAYQNESPIFFFRHQFQSSLIKVKRLSSKRSSGNQYLRIWRNCLGALLQ